MPVAFAPPSSPPPPAPRPSVLAAVLPAGHPDRPVACPRRDSVSVAFTAGALVLAAVAAGAGLAFLGGAAATLGAAALTLLFGALWIRAAGPRGGAAAGGTAALVLVAAAAGRADAQRRPEVLTRFSVAVGADARGAVTGAGAGRTLLVGYDVWRGGASFPVTLRATGTFLNRVGRAGAPTQFGGVGLDGAVSLRETGLVRPYLLAGVGAYHVSGVVGPAGATEPARVSAAAVGGAGLRVPVGTASVFVESRYTTFRGAAGGGYTPVVLGLRF